MIDSDGKYKPDPECEIALAYGYMSLLLYFGVAVMIWFAWSFVINNILDVSVNPMITRGELSLQTVGAIGWAVNVFRYAPPIILLFGFIYGINRAIFKRGR